MVSRAAEPPSSVVEQHAQIRDKRKKIVKARESSLKHFYGKHVRPVLILLSLFIMIQIDFDFTSLTQLKEFYKELFMMIL